MIKKKAIENLWKGNYISTDLLQLLENVITKTDKKEKLLTQPTHFENTTEK